MTKKKSPVTISEDGTVSVLFDIRLYSADAIKKASYKFADDLAIVLSLPSENEVLASITFQKTFDQQSKDKIVGAFCNEVIDQDLREQIAQKTEATRSLILAEAFSKTSLLREE